jgi:hypothetical protein
MIPLAVYGELWFSGAPTVALVIYGQCRATASASGTQSASLPSVPRSGAGLVGLRTHDRAASGTRFAPFHTDLHPPPTQSYAPRVPLSVVLCALSLVGFSWLSLSFSG